MQYIDVLKYCLSLPRAERISTSKLGNAFKLCVDGTAFGYFETGAPVQWRFSMRVDESDLNTLVNPPMVRVAKEKTDDHWVSIGRVESFNEEVLKEKIYWSYTKAISSS